MGDKNRKLRAAAQARMAATGQSFQAAMQAVRAEHEQGRRTEDGDGQGDAFGFATAATGYTARPLTCAYYFAWGVEELFGTDQCAQLVAHAEHYGRPGSTDPVVCFLCDRPVDVLREKEVHVGLVLHEVRQPGESRVTEQQMTVWTHERCGRGRVWSWAQLALARKRRGLPVNIADLPPKQHRRGAPVEDYVWYSLPENSPPLFYLQPGEAHRAGALGFRADRLSDGLAGVDFTRRDRGVRVMPEWEMAAGRDGVHFIARRGTGRWYQPSAPWAPPAAWLAAAHYHQGAIFLTAPAGSVDRAHLESGSGDLSALIAVGRRDVLFGAQMTVTGL